MFHLLIFVNRWNWFQVYPTIKLDHNTPTGDHNTTTGDHHLCHGLGGEGAGGITEGILLVHSLNVQETKHLGFWTFA